MQRWTRRLLAALLTALLTVMAFIPICQAEDWRSQLRQAFGLEEDAVQTEAPRAQKTPAPTKNPSKKSGKKTSNDAEPGASVEDWSLPITEPQRIVNYLAKFGKLPDNFITKKQAKALGWDSRYNYVGEVAPGKSIGGDRFGNYEGQLPKAKGRTWYECDTGYKGKKRGATRLLYSSDGLYYYTDDHYNTFTQMFPEA